MQIETDRILDTLTEIELEQSDILIKIAQYSSHIAHLRRPADVQDADGERSLLAMYEQVGVIMPDAIRQRFEDVRAFNESITANRKVHLAGELENYLERMADCEQRLRSLKARKNEAMAELARDGTGRPAGAAAAVARLVEMPTG